MLDLFQKNKLPQSLRNMFFYFQHFVYGITMCHYKKKGQLYGGGKKPVGELKTPPKNVYVQTKPTVKGTDVTSDGIISAESKLRSSSKE